MNRSTSWLLLCALHCVASMLLWWADSATVQAMVWRADSWLQRPWTLWTSAWVHLNTPQLILYQIALGTLTAFAWVVNPRLWCTLAWFLAWPLAQLSLLWWPHIGYAVGLSGPLHAGAMVLAVQLILRRIPVPKARRWGAFLALGLTVKLLLEQGWHYPVVWDNSNGVSVVPAANLTSVLWGLVLAWAAGMANRRSGKQASQA